MIYNYKSSEYIIISPNHRDDLCLIMYLYLLPLSRPDTFWTVIGYGHIINGRKESIIFKVFINVLYSADLIKIIMRYVHIT